MYPNSYRTASSMNTFNNQLSLYIPRVTPEWADADRMIAKFAELEVGVVRRIDFVEKVSDNGYTYHQAFVHFESWNDCQTTRNMQERIADPNRQCRLVYDDPWYWMLLKNKNPLSDTEYRLEQRIIDLEQRLDQNDQLFASLQQRAESSEYWLGAALRHIEHLEDTQTNYWSGADWDRAPATNPPENYTTSLEGLAEHTRLTLEDLLNDEDEKLTQEEREWLDEQIRLLKSFLTNQRRVSAVAMTNVTPAGPLRSPIASLCQNLWKAMKSGFQKMKKTRTKTLMRTQRTMMTTAHSKKPSRGVTLSLAKLVMAVLIASVLAWDLSTK